MADDFNDLGKPVPSAEETDLQTVAHAMKRLIGAGDAAIVPLRAFAIDHSLANLVAALSARPNAEAALRKWWPVVQAVGDAQSPPVSVPNLPAP